MNRLQLVPTIKSRVSDAAGTLQRYLHTSILVDGVPIGDLHFLDWKELFRTLRGPGEFFFWTSINGDPAGPIEANIHDPTFVTRDDAAQTVTWTLRLPISLNEPEVDEPDFTATFHADDYEQAFRAGWWAACKLARANRDVHVFPRGFGSAALLDLYEWLKTDDAKPFEPSYAPMPAVGTN